MVNIIEEMKFLPGDVAYIKQDIINDRSSMRINGEDVDKFLLQIAYIVSRITVEIINRDNAVAYYMIRPRYIRGMNEPPNSMLPMQDFELCDRAEAVAIIRLKDSA